MNMQAAISNAEAMTPKEWKSICLLLQEHHSMFYKVWEMGKPMFSKSIPTACVSFDPQGSFILFLFNPEFWDSLDDYNKLFVIAHESLHILFNHGYRFRDSKDKRLSNLAMDVVVNHTLTRQFGFEKERVKDWETLCWVSTLFKGMKFKGLPIKDSETVEFYLNLLRKKQSNSPPKGGSGGEGQSTQSQSGQSDSQQGDQGSEPHTLDQHTFRDAQGSGQDPESPPDLSKLSEDISKTLSPEEADYIATVFNKHKDPATAPLTLAGLGHGSSVHITQEISIKAKKKWESVVKRWTAKHLIESDKETEQWARKHRRFNMLSNSLFLPSDIDVDNWNLEKSKLVVYFYLDTSGSCWHLKDRFFSIAASLPKHRFDVKLFCFDTEVVPTDLTSRKVHGGGGTSFMIIEHDIQKEIRKNKLDGKKASYPDAVWVLTDGFGDNVKMEKPENWFWFIDAYDAASFKNVCKTYIPETCNTFNLKDFV